MALLEDLLITLLCGVGASFTHPGVIVSAVESNVDSELKNVVKQTQRSREARETLGYSQRVWKTMTGTIQEGNDELSLNKHHLLPKVWDIVLLARNLLAAKERAQNLASSEGFEAEVRRLLSLCIEKSSKPIQTGLEKSAHDKEMQMKGGYKKVMITALQFLNNLMTGNETRKLQTWLHLFGTPASINSAVLTNAPITKNTAKAKSKKSAKAQPAAGSGINTSTPITNHSETALRCNTLSAGFSAKYYKPGFLTDVPRLLQPDEIEPLLMIIQSGVVYYEGADPSMQSVRCKLMLAQGYGRSLLREILVFLGAWEIDEEDFCYRILGQIVESILQNGLIPYAYESFRDEKDIVTPAQSVILKLLVSVYRPQPALPPHNQADWPCGSPVTSGNAASTAQSFCDSIYAAPPQKRTEDGSSVDQPPPIQNTIPTFFVSVFRRQVLSSVIGVIQLQGAIKSKQKPKDAFEYSLWDLDRVYEGVYQFLELFVLFSEDEDAKEILVTGERGLISDLVKLLGELDKAIPRYIATKTPRTVELPKKTVQKKESYLVERPFDISGDGNDEDDEDEDGEYSDDRELVEPDEFTWPNIKRFIVILLSSLAWHNKTVQDLIREKGGLHLVLNQCSHDDDNPYIREHSILCVRALLQGNKENQKIVEELNATGVVPSEILDRHGYEPFIDEKGRVKLKRTDVELESENGGSQGY